MIKGILTFQFELNQSESGDIEPNYSPIQVNFTDKKYNIKNYNELIGENDIFSIFIPYIIK